MSKNLALIAIVTVLAGLAVFSMTENGSSEFESWKSQYGANWGADEEAYRKIVFERNLQIIKKHNADSTQSYKMGVNQFTALTDEEFYNTYLDPKPMVGRSEADTGMIVTADVDWVTKGMVSPVKNQGSCGSCWAFSATGVSESWAKMKAQTVSLSEQQLVDCSGSFGNQGCNGGWPENALKYVKANGLSTESEYPYVAKNQACKKTGGNFKISSIVSASGCTGLQNAIQGRPVSVTVDATNWSKYSSGVFTNCASSINHAVLLVGLTSSYWKIKNSWGTSWGESGYIRLGLGNTCGVCAYAGVYPN